jgi:sensory rhodopsin transducer
VFQCARSYASPTSYAGDQQAYAITRQLHDQDMAGSGVSSRSCAREMVSDPLVQELQAHTRRVGQPPTVSKEDDTKQGSKLWYIPDGWLPVRRSGDAESHESISVLNVTTKQAERYADDLLRRPGAAQKGLA